MIESSWSIYYKCGCSVSWLKVARVLAINGVAVLIDEGGVHPWKFRKHDFEIAVGPNGAPSGQHSVGFGGPDH